MIGLQIEEKKVMNKVTAALAIILLSATGSVAAERKWVNFDPSFYDEEYFDMASKKNLGKGKIKVDTLMDYNPEHGLSHQILGKSNVESIVLDCIKHKFKHITSTWYSDYQGKGKVTDHGSYLDQRWHSISIDDQMERLFDMICPVKGSK